MGEAHRETDPRLPARPLEAPHLAGPRRGAVARPQLLGVLGAADEIEPVRGRHQPVEVLIAEVDQRRRAGGGAVAADDPRAEEEEGTPAEGGKR